MTQDTPQSPSSTEATKQVVHLLVGDLSRTACRVPATPAMNVTTVADHASCRECILNSGRN
ncbi:MAG: hypothetical protein GEU80_17465 [Dehalococcoidia bacterium]|nr:hypothetical protein [Dehalococcoidia bacterium]